MDIRGRIRTKILTQDFLREVFTYDFENGGLIWKRKADDCQENRRWNTRYAGKHAGSPNNQGYLHVKLGGRKYKLHRLVFLYMHGYLPKIVDHKDNDLQNNRIENLRAADHQKNNYNCRISSANTSGIKGVSWHKQHKKWYATIRVNGKAVFLGIFDKKSDAEERVKAAREELHGEFSNNG